MRNENPFCRNKIAHNFNFYCVLILTGIALLACLCAALLAYFKNGFLFLVGKVMLSTQLIQGWLN